MDHEYVQPVLMFDKLPKELICQIIVILNDGVIGDDVKPECGFLHPGYRGGRELHYFKISRDAMTFWKHVCKDLRLMYQVHDMLLSKNTPNIEMWEDPHIHENGNCCWDDYNSHERYIPRHLYAGNLKSWMRLCYGPQTHEEALAIEADEEAKVVAKRARKEKRPADAAIALDAGWDSVERRLRSRNM